MRIALLQDGLVENLAEFEQLWQAQAMFAGTGITPLPVDDDHPVQIGDAYREGQFYREGVPLSDYGRDWAAEARRMRNQLLQDCDVVYCNVERWEAMPQAEKQTWRAYKQALRDLPLQAGFPMAIIWPELPSSPLESAKDGA